MLPLAWLPARQIVAALEVRATRPIVSYVTVRAGAIERSTITPTPNADAFSASRDGTRIVVTLPTAVRWWPIDQPGAAKDLAARPGDTIGRAEFRPGADEIGVDLGGRFEIWTLSDQRRVVARQAGTFVHWRVDGTGAITELDPNTVLLVDPSSGASVPLPGGGFPVADVVLF